MYIVKGIKKNSGVFENGRQWCNYDLHCLSDKEEENLLGYTVKVIRVSSQLFLNTENNFGDLLDRKVKFDFDVARYNGKEKVIVTSIDVLD